jgi:hypothetical protein
MMGPPPGAGYGPEYGMMGPQGPVDPAYYQAQPYGPPMVQPVQHVEAPYGAPMGGAPCGDCMGGDCGMGGPCDCGPCMDCGPCCEPCPPHGCPTMFNFDIETSILVPVLDGNTANGTLASPTVPALATFDALSTEIDDTVTLTPRFFLHCQKCEWGLGARVWYLGESEADFTPIDQLQLAIVGDFVEERLETLISDAEVTYSWDCCHGHHLGICGGSSFQVGVGLRYADFETDTVAFGSAILDDVLATTTAVARTEFDGVGITSGIRGTKYLCKTVSLYWALRGSAIFGDLEGRVQSSASAVGVGAASAAVNVAGAASEEQLMIGEALIGVQWEHELRCIPACAFFRVAGEYQHWDFDSSLFAAATSTVNIASVPGTIASATSNATAVGPDLDLFGLTLGAGLTW